MLARFHLLLHFVFEYLFVCLKAHNKFSYERTVECRAQQKQIVNNNDVGLQNKKFNIFLNVLFAMFNVFIVILKAQKNSRIVFFPSPCVLQMGLSFCSSLWNRFFLWSDVFWKRLESFMIEDHLPSISGLRLVYYLFNWFILNVLISNFYGQRNNKFCMIAFPLLASRRPSFIGHAVTATISLNLVLCFII